MKNALWFMLCIAGLSCQMDNNIERNDLAIDEESIAAFLPFDTLDLSNLASFDNPGENWIISGRVAADLNTKHDLHTEDGAGVLVNVAQDATGENLLTSMQHGDLEIHFEVMMPKGSNSGMYFQGRYEVQLFDSWGREEVSFGDMGGLYQRWDNDRGKGREGYDGHSPPVNAAMAPGLWQHFHVLFRAPRFDEAGTKISDARFEFVKLNGYTLFEGAILSGPTRASTFQDESPQGPLMLQGDHGPVAFRNIRYKTYGFDTLELQDLAYEFYEGKWDYIPNWDTLTPTKTGMADLLDPKLVAEQPDHYGMVFKGKLRVKNDGPYLFETSIDDGGHLYIDSQLVVANEGEPGEGTERGLVELTAGSHDFVISYYQEVWAASLVVHYEGPQISRRPLASKIEVPEWVKKQASLPPILVTSNAAPELVRGFVQHGNTKLTHAISVGHPAGVHYSYDLDQGTPVKAWKGNFVDVTNMWRARGVSQLAIPLNAAIEFTPGHSLAKLEQPSSPWPDRPNDFVHLGYRLDRQGAPHYRYQLGETLIEDHLQPVGSDRLRRTLHFEGDDAKAVWHRIAQADEIVLLPNGLYNVGGRYYVECQEAQVREQEYADELLVRSETSNANIEYEILW